MKFKSYSLKGALGALAIGAALLFGASETANAQGYRDLREHQRLERHYYGDSPALREHQRRERRGYFNDRYYYGPYNRGYYNYGPYYRGDYGNSWGPGWGLGLGFGWGAPYRRGW
jgi:hypothetical protein